MRNEIRAALTTLILAALCLGSAGAATAGESAADLAAAAVKASGHEQGLCLVLGETDGALTAALAKASRLYVQGCTWEAGSVAAARGALVAAGAANNASLVAIEGEGLPYADNLVNVIVAGPGAGRGVTAAEILRVLAPGGLALVRADLEAGAKAAGARDVKASALPGWVQFGKAVDPAFDVWTQNSGGADQSSVNNDKAAGPWAELRWVGDPRWGALYCVYRGRVTAGGRIYYKENRAAAGGGVVVWLVARDAWNGTELWRIPTGPPPKYGSVDNTLTCDETRVYSVEDNKALTARDGKTGKKLLEYAPGFMPTVATSTGSVLLTCDLGVSPAVARKVAALDKDSGKILWSRPGIAHPAAEGDAAFVLGAGELEAVTIATGASQWKAPVPKVNGSPRVFCKAGVVYVQHKPTWTPPSYLGAFDARKGEQLWKRDNPSGGFGTLATPEGVWLLEHGKNAAVLDPRTGAETHSYPVKGLGKCFPPTGCANFLLYCSSSYLDLKSGAETNQTTVRSPCALGHVPANGLTYFLPHHCSCHVTLRGFLAMAARSKSKAWLPEGKDGAPQLFTSGPAPAAAAEGPEDWPMFRKDPARSNFTTTKLPTELKPLWSEKAGASRLTQAVVAYGLVCAAEPQTHRVFARDATSGKELWSFVADGRTEWAPALTKGLCIFSTGAGSVYALDARTGKEVWRLRAAPVEKYIAEEGQFASAWPVVGGVMPQNGEIFFSCGRSAGVDGGMWVFAADAATGKVRWRTKGGTSGDLFLSDGKELMLTRVRYSIANGGRVGGGKEPPGLLRATPYLTYVSVMDLMATVEPLLASNKHEELTDGRITGEALAFSDKLGVAAWRYRFGVPKEMMKKGKENHRFIYAVSEGKNRWLLDEDIRQQMLGVVLAGETAYLAGVPASLDPKDKGELWVLSGTDGKKLQTLTLDSKPVYDGLSAAGGRLYLAAEDGTLTCFGAK
ncbi:MAG TPA: PQQ-binding-like beta-propeller repeat protein [Planctomycetota bacterium]|nr:PQQ-binding-like beta-propeller repeat protein [Planctomycetota bacterium]